MPKSQKNLHYHTQMQPRQHLVGTPRSPHSHKARAHLDRPSSIELRPFLACPTALADIKTLLISPTHNMTIILTDTDVYTLARACPRLYSINLGNHNTPVSLGALGYIVRRCRELCEVSLCVDALGTAPLDDDEQVRPQPNRRLMKLDIGESPIACVGPLDPLTAPDLMMSIPRFLHMIAPRLAELEISLGLYFEWTRQTEMETRNDMERWEKVEDALSELAQEDG
ncbi:hypothetical protein EV702DRAFT_1269338 [Suillus placidus]|uniref:Uncharacterized protein n=1 Tax=Suillus placidus TaxID=48579 RepID=A0A9P7D194_9AGAM|nr:hypothetical protein EV702DRAFT_1269338 [Suillus placidus]